VAVLYRTFYQIDEAVLTYLGMALKVRLSV